MKEIWEGKETLLPRHSSKCFLLLIFNGTGHRASILIFSTTNIQRLSHSPLITTSTKRNVSSAGKSKREGLNPSARQRQAQVAKGHQGHMQSRSRTPFRPLCRLLLM